MINVVNFDPHAKEAEQRKRELIEVLDEIRSQVERGEIKELVACSMDRDGAAQIHASVLDLAGRLIVISPFELSAFSTGFTSTNTPLILN